MFRNSLVRDDSYSCSLRYDVRGFISGNISYFLDNRVVASVGFVARDNGDISLGSGVDDLLFVDPSYRGRFLSFKVCKFALDVGITSLGSRGVVPRRVLLPIHAENVTPRRLAEHAGFRLLSDDPVDNMVLYGLDL